MIILINLMRMLRHIKKIITLSSDLCIISKNTCSATSTERNRKYELYKLDKGPDEDEKLDAKDANSMLEKMLYIRRMETKAAELYRARLINGFCHLYSGQEAIAVGIRNVMQQNDTVITAYRCHGFAVTFGISARQVFAELMGRKTGVSKGKGGSMHMYATNFYGGDGIVGGQVPVGAGLAFAHKYNDDGGVSFTLFGDGAASQGQIFEAWNMSKLWNLPAVFVCENNKYGMGTITHRHSANDQFHTRGDVIPGIKVNGMKVEQVREAAKFAREFAIHNGPIILEMVTYRYYGHSMSDPGTNYRTREEVQSIKDKKDPIQYFVNYIQEKNLMSKEEIEKMKKAIFKAVDSDFEESKKDTWPEISEISTNVYVNKLEECRGLVPWHKV